MFEFKIYLLKKFILECEDILSLSVKDGWVFVGLICFIVVILVDVECFLFGVLVFFLLLIVFMFKRFS